MNPGHPGENRFADDLHLSVPGCRMTAYEVAVRGTHPTGSGALVFELRYNLSDSSPENGYLISNTRRQFFWYGRDVRVARFQFDPPIPIPADLWITFGTSSDQVGPVHAGIEPTIGSSAEWYARYYYDDYRLRPHDQWYRAEFDDLPYGAFEYGTFDVTIYCEGELPTGACCGMVLTDDDGEAVCRDVPRMNCQFPELWKQGATCDSTCIGGDNDGRPCTRAVDCPGGDCPGPFPKACGLSACCVKGERCENLTEHDCFARDIPWNLHYHPGRYCDVGGFSCPRDACAFVYWGADCDEPDTYACVGSEYPGLQCFPDRACEDSLCCRQGGTCEPRAGCRDVECCTRVCDEPGFNYCCARVWDQACVDAALTLCNQVESLSMDECAGDDSGKGAKPVRFLTTETVDLLRATTDPTDPPACCVAGQPGAQGLGSVWYKFIAPPDIGEPFGSSARLTLRPELKIWDTILQVFEAAEPDLGVCDDRTMCSLSAQDCADGMPCTEDDEIACGSLTLHSCTDVEDRCVGNLVPGRTYYAMLTAKDEECLDTYRMEVQPYCEPTPFVGLPDCDGDGTPDTCDIAYGKAEDCNANLVRDDCEPDGDADGVTDGCDSCPDAAASGTISFERCDTGVPDQVDDEGCPFSGKIVDCLASAKNHGEAVACITRQADRWRRDGAITGEQHGRITACAARKTTPGGLPAGGRHDGRLRP